ncbi:bifunctional proline dehydrogenase/L-glutamate gamma-semialdehyde dehydrogenase PutA [Roseovarius sp. SCSIO 43702]|uniref:bifunctional proline dehydrogenase/L-glutamate gamma-semialdehyde dehydrogenase PutA n=1 Tax=Roseovarius sp. SCSIO 43702 TaxID=2823043 RepID=UPI001C733D81|nr:bifunctional proline dehydrogenase/L-glutamate gamma-semialdehyde dehydrogenase PutA [Roseovarius sp. SCSIO 43702]QYX57329.1 bifunctional proline dehydrogenase/L-glutamate gamma-semialdehyde dehydrogenase PutA [Roseovarius sp. SCSIO 43702]
MNVQTAPRLAVDQNMYADERATLERLAEEANLSAADRERIAAHGAKLVREIRAKTDPGMMEVFLAEYGLSTEEGIALMCLAEALLRVPDADTIDALIEDKIAPSDWGSHMGHSTSSLVNASTWALMLTGKVLKDERPGPVGHLRSAIKRLGEPVIRTAVGRAMREMGRQFVLGETIQGAMERARKQERKGYTYSYDMLGEAARTDADATRYHLAYSRAISAIAEACHHKEIARNPGISVKLSALHPRYEEAQREEVMEVLMPRLRGLALLAKSARMGLNIDAEEADRLALSLDVIEAVLSEPALEGWDGFGVVVQAYGQRAGDAIDYLYNLAEKHDRRIMVRLVKGAYWDTEIKRAQVEGIDGFPVFTSKAATDISYIANARKLLSMTDRIYPQFATHNAHTVAAILDMAGNDKEAFEFQRLHGMGESLHDIVMDAEGTRCRIYAPVGAHRDLLAYLVRRLLENGANSSFVNQIVDEDVPPEEVARDPFEVIKDSWPSITRGPDLFRPERVNSRGFDLTHAPTLALIEEKRAPFAAGKHQWQAAPLLAGDAAPNEAQPVRNPADPADTPGTVAEASEADIETALANAAAWDASPEARAEILNKVADLYEANFGEIFAALAREAGKLQLDAVAELREAVDFLRYYAANAPQDPPVGVFTCISPWNFPLAIFTGQIAAALAAGNAVLSKPAEQTPLIAHIAIGLMHEAGVPRSALQLLPGGGAVGAALTSDARVGGVAFTGSTETAHKIRAAMAKNLAPGAPLIAETGGLNAMIVDSTALPEQAVQAIVESAFQSAGQRCSALRCLYVQDDIAPGFLEMLTGAMDALNVGNPWYLSTDCGPVIDEEARTNIAEHIQTARAEGRLLHELKTPNAGTFIAPTLIRVDGIEDLEREVFGPVLHVATFRSQQLDQVIEAINATGYGLTFGLMTRIDDRVQHVTEAVHAGNIYVNRNQIGAIVGSQPFGGEGLSGTGPKAGGPHYLTRFTARPAPMKGEPWGGNMDDKAVAKALAEPQGDHTVRDLILPGPTGESNKLSVFPRAPLLCLGPGRDAARAQAKAVTELGGRAALATGHVAPETLRSLSGFSGALWWGDEETARAYARALSERDGPILPLVTGAPDTGHACHERHVCVDTTAAGGNAALLGGVA